MALDVGVVPWRSTFSLVIVAVAGAVVVGDEEFVGVVGIESIAGVRRRALCTSYGCRLCLPVLAFLPLVAVPGLSYPRRSRRLVDVKVGSASAWLLQHHQHLCVAQFSREINLRMIGMILVASAERPLVDSGFFSRDPTLRASRDCS